MIYSSEIVRQIYEGGRRPFVVSAHQTQSYRELAAQISAWLSAYDNAGLMSRDRILIATSDEAATVAAFLAAMLDGKVPAIISPDSGKARQAGLAAHFEPSLVVSDTKPDWIGQVPLLDPMQVGSGRRAIFGRRVEGRRPLAAIASEEVAYVMFTSGSTSAPKGVVISHGALAAQLGELVSLFGYDQNARIFNGLMLSHADGLIQGPILAAATGAAWLRPPNFTPATIEDWLNLVSGLSATHFLSVPAVYAMIDRLAVHDDYFDLPSLELLQSVGAKLPDTLRGRIEARFGKPMANHYGLTETVASALYDVPGNACSGKGDLGRGLGVETRLIDTKGREATDGELCLRGAQVFEGYWRAPALTDAALHDGWLRTGDLARREIDGSISIQGRIKTSINTGGLLVMPDEIDEVLVAHPAVAEAASVGIEDEVFGEIAVTAVVLGVSIDEATLADYCRLHLEPLKVPKRIITVEAIPRGDAGKPQVVPLRTLLLERLAEIGIEPYEGDELSEVIALAAKIFRVQPEELSTKSTPDTVAAWDSFTHLSLILEAERHFVCRLDTAAIARINSLGDLANAIA